MFIKSVLLDFAFNLIKYKRRFVKLITENQASMVLEGGICNPQRTFEYQAFLNVTQFVC